MLFFLYILQLVFFFLDGKPRSSFFAPKPARKRLLRNKATQGNMIRCHAGFSTTFPSMQIELAQSSQKYFKEQTYQLLFNFPLTNLMYSFNFNMKVFFCCYLFKGTG